MLQLHPPRTDRFDRRFREVSGERRVRIARTLSRKQMQMSLFMGYLPSRKGYAKSSMRSYSLPSCFLQAAEGGKITQIVFCTILQNPPLKLCDSSGCEWSRAAWQIAVKNRFAVKLTNISRTVNTNLLTLTICFWSDGSFEVEAFVCRNEIIYLGVGEYKSCNHDKPTCLLILLTSSRPLSQTLQMAKRRNRCRV